MPLLAEELMDLTLEELINEHGADIQAREHWFGIEFEIRVSGLTLYSAPADYPLEGDTLLVDNFEDIYG